MYREKKIAEIREALERATPGPWHMSKLSAGYLVDDRGKDITVFIEYNEDGSVHMEFENWQNNARLIANAPEWLGFLLDELEQTRKESNMLREELHKFQELAIKAANHHKAERDKLIEGLRWYADEENQKLDESTRHWENVYSPYEMDGGHRARNILKEIGVTVE